MKTTWSAVCILAFVGVSAAQDEGKKGKAPKFDGNQLFGRFDKNGDGKLDKAEIQAVPERLRTGLSRADANNDGEISRDEFTRALGAMSGMKGKGDIKGKGFKGGKPGEEPKPGDGKNKKPQAPGGELGARVKAMDKNGDGKISKDEAQGPLAQFFDRIDRNGDGFITMEETEEMGKKFGKNKNPGAPPKNNGKPKGEEPKPGDGKGKKFGKGAPKDGNPLAMLDTNSDGKIARNEAKGPLAANFDRLDVNKDGFISGEEGQAIRRLLAAGAGAMKSTVDLFNNQDADADGRLTKEEAKGEIADNFAKWDSDKDGKLTRQEVEAGVKAGGQEKAKGKS
jgi:Ca2+-binding EF-hand superfamily protein